MTGKTKILINSYKWLIYMSTKGKHIRLITELLDPKRGF
jgi:hypothetical protein